MSLVADYSSSSAEEDDHDDSGDLQTYAKVTQLEQDRQSDEKNHAEDENVVNNE